jgi:uncharacterized protein YdhG (YjbR/CyaY superfamily)
MVFLFNFIHMPNAKPETVDQYISAFPAQTQMVLHVVRQAILTVLPAQAIEVISYGMPAFKINKKPIVYFAAYKSHIGFYATPTGHAAFASALCKYKQGKGSVQFPLLEPMPIALIKKIVKFRIKECLA